MISIIKNEKQHAIFKKDKWEAIWFNHDCSDENLLKQLDREGDKIKRVQFEDGTHIGSLLNIYF